MGWVRIDDSFYDHPAMVDLDLAHWGLWAWSLAFSNRNLTDGRISLAAVKRMDPDGELTQALIDAGRWHLLPDAAIEINDYLDYQRSSEQIREHNQANAHRAALRNDKELVRSIRARDGNRCRYCGRRVDWTDRKSAKGGTYDHVIPRGPNTAENVVVACRGCNSRKGARTPEQAGMPLLEPGTAIDDRQISGRKRPDITGIEPQPQPQPDTDVSESGAHSAPPTTTVSRRTRGTRIPDPFIVTDDMVTWAETELPRFDWARETVRFKDHWLAAAGAKGVKQDWPATWRNWMRRAAEGTYR